MGVFACGWLGFVFTRGACSRGVFALSGCWRFGGAVGRFCVPSPPLPRLAWCSRSCVGVVGVCGVLRARWAEGCQVGGGTRLSRPLLRGAGLLRSPRGAEREKAGVLTLGVLTRAHAQRERGGARGADRGGLAGGAWRSGASDLVATSAQSRGRAKLTL